MSVVLFIGAGASKADGLPLQTELFKEFFARPAATPDRNQLAEDIAGLFEVVFGIDPRSHPGTALPTFEEALGVLELAMNREEGILGLRGEHQEKGLRHLRRQLILALAATVARQAKSSQSTHSKLVRKLREKALLDDVTFVTTNYDTLLDEAIETDAIIGSRGTGSIVDYGIAGLVSTPSGDYQEARTFPCYKIHGSLNWLYCGTCDILDVTYGSDGVIQLLDKPTAARCSTCEMPRTPVIVPPSYYRNTTNTYLALVWHKAFHAARQATHVVFCGYSFPDADMHVKYLIKRAQLNRDPLTQPLHFSLVNQSPGKSQVLIDSEYQRFARFLGSDVTDTGLTFEDFAANPAAVLS